MKPSLYAQYVKEKYGHECIENEHGFLVYQLCGLTCNIELLYVDKDHRLSGVAKTMVNQLVQSLPKRIKCLSCEIDTKGNGAFDSYAAIAKYGFEVLNTRGHHIVMVKYL